MRVGRTGDRASLKSLQAWGWRALVSVSETKRQQWEEENGQEEKQTEVRRLLNVRETAVRDKGQNQRRGDADGEEEERFKEATWNTT